MGRAIDVNSHEMYVNENTISEIIDYISSTYPSKGIIVCPNEDCAWDIRNRITNLCGDNGIAANSYDRRWTGDCYFKFNFYDGGYLLIANRKHYSVENVLASTNESEDMLYDRVLIDWQLDYAERKSYGISLTKAYQLLKTPMVDISEEELNDISDLFG